MEARPFEPSFLEWTEDLSGYHLPLDGHCTASNSGDGPSRLYSRRKMGHLTGSYLLPPGMVLHYRALCAGLLSTDRHARRLSQHLVLFFA